MTSEGALTYACWPMVFATCALFFGSSMYFEASMMARITSFRSPRRFPANSLLTPNDFSGWCFQMSWLANAVKPIPSFTATPFQGSPTQ